MKCERCGSAMRIAYESLRGRVICFRCHERNNATLAFLVAIFTTFMIAAVTAIAYWKLTS